MDSSTYLKGFIDISPDEITGLIAHVGPLLKLLSEEHKGKKNAGDKLAQSYTHKTTSCEILTAYAMRDLLTEISQHFADNPGNKLVDSPKPIVPGKSRPGRMPLPPGLGVGGPDGFNFDILMPSHGGAAMMEEILPVNKMAKLFLSHESKVWFRVVLSILFSFPSINTEKETTPAEQELPIDPRNDRFSLLTDSQKVKLLKAYTRYSRANTTEDEEKEMKQKQKVLIDTLKDILGGSHPCKITLHDVLHFLKMSTKDLRATSDVLGLPLLAPADSRILSERLPELKNRSQKLRDACSGLLRFLCEHQSPIFSHRRRKFEDSFNDALTSLTLDELREARNKRLAQHLRHFFEIRDPPMVRCVGLLFKYYEFNDIATGIFAKYRILPYGWKQELEKASGQVNDGFDPFNSYIDKNSDVAEGSSKSRIKRRKKKKHNDYTTIKGSYFEADEAQEGKGLNNLMLSMRLEQGQGSFGWLKKYLEKRKVKFLTEKTLTWPEVSPLKVYAPSDKKSYEADHVVDEFIGIQADLLKTLKVFQSVYVSELIAIARGDLGPDAATALGISLADVKKLFVSNFKEVIAAQERLVNTFEPLLLVKKGKVKAPWTTWERPGVLFLLFVSCKKHIIQGFKHYNAAYKRKSVLFEELRHKVLEGDRQRPTQASEASRGSIRRNKRPTRHLNFIHLFDEIAASKNLLASKQLASILIAPVQSVPRYKLFLERILKSMKKRDPGYPGTKAGMEAMKTADAISNALNDNIKKNKEVLGKILGDEVYEKKN